MNISIKLSLSVFAVAMLMSGCAQKIQIIALNPAEVGEMASMKKIAISKFKNDSLGLSGKIESEIAKHKLDNEKYFTVLSRQDMDKVIAEQKLQSSELMDNETSSKVGKLIGAQAIINGEIASANAESRTYQEDKEECLSYYKQGGCAKWRYYRVTCNTTQATASANLNIVNIETGALIYGDTISKEYSADSCKAGQTNLGLLVLNSGPQTILSKAQALNKLASDIANEFVYKLTPHYVTFEVTLLEKLEMKKTTSEQDEQFENSLAYIKANRLDKAEELLRRLMDEFDGKSYVVAYNLGVVNEANGKYDDAKKYYSMADTLTIKPVDELNLAINRIDKLISKREKAEKQISSK